MPMDSLDKMHESNRAMEEKKDENLGEVV